jgi:DNA-binding PadR family transcriptional regulator
MENTQPLTESLFYILLALRVPNHGYGIIQEVSSLTGGRLVMGAGTLYGAIQLLLDRQWIILHRAETTSRKKKEYTITDRGRDAFQTECARLQELIKNAQLMAIRQEEL